MMKKEKVIKYGIISLLGILLINPLKVTAAPNATANFVGKDTIENLYVYDGDTGEKKPYQNSHFTVTANGETFPAYCIDPGLNLSSGASLTCSDDYLSNGQRGALEWLINDSGLTGDHWRLQLGLRYLARDIGLSTKGIDSEPWSDVPSMNVRLNNLRQMALGGKGHTSTFKPNKSGSTDTTDGTLTLGEASGSGQNYTIPLTTTLDPNSLKVSCTGCETSTISGNTINVTLKKNICSFTLTVTYNGKEAQSSTPARYSQKRPVLCRPTSGKIQTMFVYTDIVFQDKLSASKKYNVGGENCTEPEQPDKCNEKTQVKIPDYCDISGNEITITAPKNVQYCILNGKDDAENTYKMDDGQLDVNGESNPYCAVYCKEDYEMTLPGAQYTESGRYFELENTIVKATRTCYATNPKGNSDEPQIDIDQFITDIKTKQEQLVNAFNEYQKANAMLESVKDIRSHNTNQVTCKAPDTCSGTYVNNVCSGNTIKGCSNTFTNDAHYGNTKNYKVATLVVKNAKEGSYTVKLSSASLSDNYGVFYSCNGGCSGTENLVGTYKTIGEYEANRNAKLAALHEAQNELAKTIEFMEKCYNWVNNLCLNPEVLFDYNEQYSSDINYTLVSGGGDFKGTDAKYIDQKTLSNNQYVATTSDSTLEKVEYAYCDETTCNNSFERGIAEKISTLVKHYYYRSIEVKGTAEYANIQEFQTNYPHGTIDTIPEGAEIHKNYSYLGAVFPVALNTKTGVYQWTLNFSNLGMYNDEPSCKNGRLDDVVNVVTGGSASAGIDYVCVYVVDCDDCTYDCVGDYCEYDDEEEKCPECDVYCTNCIFDGDGFTYNYEVVSINEMNPNERTMGSNWTSEKGQKVLASIEDAAETAYEIAQYVIKLNPNNMKELRDLNKEKQNYVSDELDYHEKNGIQNAYGTSAILRDEKNQKRFFQEIKLNDDWELWASVDKANHVGPAYK